MTGTLLPTEQVVFQKLAREPELYTYNRSMYGHGNTRHQTPDSTAPFAPSNILSEAFSPQVQPYRIQNTPTKYDLFSPPQPLADGV